MFDKRSSSASFLKKHDDAMTLLGDRRDEPVWVQPTDSLREAEKAHSVGRGSWFTIDSSIKSQLITILGIYCSNYSASAFK
jgi:hypothetical protein